MSSFSQSSPWKGEVDIFADSFLCPGLNCHLQLRLNARSGGGLIRATRWHEHAEASIWYLCPFYHYLLWLIIQTILLCVWWFCGPLGCNFSYLGHGLVFRSFWPRTSCRNLLQVIQNHSHYCTYGYNVSHIVPQPPVTICQRRKGYLTRAFTLNLQPAHTYVELLLPIYE